LRYLEGLIAKELIIYNRPNFASETEMLEEYVALLVKIETGSRTESDRWRLPRPLVRRVVGGGAPTEQVPTVVDDSSFRIAEGGRGPISPSEVRHRLRDGISIQGSDPILPGEIDLRILVETDLRPRQPAALGGKRIRPTLESLDFLARVPREIPRLVRDYALPNSKAELIGRYLADAPIKVQLKTACSIVRHSLGSAEAQRMGRIYSASHDFRFPE
jgi:hypothetical protein